MKKAKKIFSGWFLVWATLAVLLTVLILIVGKHNNGKTAQWMAATILATFTLLPARDWLYRFIVWALDFVSSINTPFKDRINPYATYNRLIDPKTREVNVGFYRTIKFLVGLAAVIVALLWMIFQGVSFNVVYSVIHTVEFILRGKISFLAILFYIILTGAFCYLVYWFVGQVLNGRLYRDDGRIDWPNAWWKITMMLGGFYAKIIICSLLMAYTASMLWSKVLFWTVVVGLPILVFEVWRLIQRLRSRRS